MFASVMILLVVAGSLVFHFISPWRATPVASNWGSIDEIMALTFIITGIGFVAVGLFLVFCLWRFRHKPGSKADYEPENARLELILTIITTLAVVILLAPGLLVWGQFVTPPENAAQIEAVGVQWNWSFRLPGADYQLGTSDVRMIDATNSLGVNPGDPRSADDLIITDGELHLPVNKPVKVLLRSVDVLHDFYIPQVRAKMDLVPGIVSYLWFTPTTVGEYEILCAAYCGNGHPQMRGKLIVDSDEDYEKWLHAQQTFTQIRKAQAENIKVGVN